MDYTAPGIGKGAKARKRLTLDTIPKDMDVKPRKKDSRKRYERKPELERTRAKDIEDATSAYNSASLKTRIRMLVIDEDASYLDVVAVMKKEGVSVSGVVIGNLRAEMREILRLLEQQGLIDSDALARRRRKKAKKGDAA